MKNVIIWWKDDQRFPESLISEKLWYFYKRFKCISGLPCFLWPRFPLTCDKPVGGHAPTVISSKGCECAVRKGDVGVLQLDDNFWRAKRLPTNPN
ncbi:hypothetical protein GHT06_011920 [Daphnia sinensis]|uniref:Uncharacterized protein n=1 Tax=Daphnia sinensis TaxID=1820382 RepID=A0AAD5KWJ7_9CRUS|nr:hypothetical protein GHT06_011920 [Daphnia sinensis]